MQVSVFVPSPEHETPDGALKKAMVAGLGTVSVATMWLSVLVLLLLMFRS